MKFWRFDQAIELIPEPWFDSPHQKNLLQDAHIFAGGLVVEAYLSANLCEICELPRIPSKDLKQPRHLIEFFDVCNILHIALHNRPDIVTSPCLASVGT